MPQPIEKVKWKRRSENKFPTQLDNFREFMDKRQQVHTIKSRRRNKVGKTKSIKH